MPRCEPIIPEGQHLGTSRDVEVAVTGHLFSDGDNKLQGHAAWREVEDSEDDASSNYDHASSYQQKPPRQLTQEEIERAAELAALMIVGLVRGVQWASSRVKRWWDNSAAPTLRSTWTKIRRRKASDPATIDLGHVTANRATFVAFSAGVEISVAQSKIRMTSAEWEQRLQAMIAAAAFQDEQRRILAYAQIEDDNHVLKAGSSQQELTPRQFAERVRMMLQANPTLLSDASTAEIIHVLIQSGPDEDFGLVLRSKRR